VLSVGRGGRTLGQPTKHVRTHTHKLKPLNHFTVVLQPLSPLRFNSRHLPCHAVVVGARQVGATVLIVIRPTVCDGTQRACCARARVAPRVAGTAPGPAAASAGALDCPGGRRARRVRRLGGYVGWTRPHIVPRQPAAATVASTRAGRCDASTVNDVMMSSSRERCNDLFSGFSLSFLCAGLSIHQCIWIPTAFHLGRGDGCCKGPPPVECTEAT